MKSRIDTRCIYKKQILSQEIVGMDRRGYDRGYRRCRIRNNSFDDNRPNRSNAVQRNREKSCSRNDAHETEHACSQDPGMAPLFELLER